MAGLNEGIIGITNETEDIRIDREIVLEKYEIGARIGTGGYGECQNRYHTKVKFTIWL